MHNKYLGEMNRTEITLFGPETVVYPLACPKYITREELWDGLWLNELPKPNQQMNLFDGL